MTKQLQKQLQSRLVGNWAGEVIHDGENDPYTVTLRADGTLTFVTHRSTAEGTWESTGDDSFAFHVKEVFNADHHQVSPTGFHVDHIIVDFNASLEGDSVFTGGGQAQAYSPAGETVFATSATTRAKRVS